MNALKELFQLSWDREALRYVFLNIWYHDIGFSLSSFNRTNLLCFKKA